jgi:hypothetical protein
LEGEMPNKYAQALHAEMMQRLKPLEEQGVIWMVKPIFVGDGDFSREPWPDGEWVTFRIRSTEVKKKYQSEDEDCIGVIAEALDEPWVSQWAYIDVNHLRYTRDAEGKIIKEKTTHNLAFGKDNEPLSTWAKLAMAVDEDFDPGAADPHPELEDMVGKMFRGFIEPRKNPKYAKFLKYKPLSAAEKVKYDLGATDDGVAKEGDEPIPFHHLTDERKHSEYGHSHHRVWNANIV